MNKCKTIFNMAALTVVVFSLYWQTLDNPLFFDDFVSYASGKGIDSGVVNTRALTALTFSALSHFGLVAQHAFNVFLHVCNAFLLYVFLKRLYSEHAATFVSIFFAVNPAAIYAVAYLTQRSQLLMLFFGLCQCLLYWKALSTCRRWISPVCFVMSLFCFGLVMLSKEQGVVFLAIYPLLSVAHRSSPVRSVLFNVALIPIVYALYLFSRGFFFVPLETSTWQNWFNCAAVADQHHIYLRSIITQCRLFFKYFALWLVPLPTSIDMREIFVRSVWDFKWAAIFVGYAIGSGCLLLNRATRCLGFGLVLAACFIMPELTRVRAGDIFVVYRSYIYAFAYMIALGWFVDAVVPTLNRKSFVVFFVILTVTCFVTQKRLQTFESPALLWAHAASLIDVRNPELKCQAARAFNNTGSALLRSGRPTEAVSWLQKAVEIKPDYLAAIANLDNAYLLINQEVEQCHTR